ncbi:unnamed protein product [marine sediment metagenome]|uniref:Uncharacterized protein n=1 Tax=marine sediment metagenome TaxID=412755 RepID=X1ADT8_9ZZZZ
MAPLEYSGKKRFKGKEAFVDFPVVSNDAIACDWFHAAYGGTVNTRYDNKRLGW